jgi:carbon storage regulator
MTIVVLPDRGAAKRPGWVMFPDPGPGTVLPQPVGDGDGRKEPVMLVLSRQRDQSIMIGENIVITIVDIRGDKVRLGIDAPIEIPVHRQEVFDAIQREAQEAAEAQKRDQSTQPADAPPSADS